MSTGVPDFPTIGTWSPVSHHRGLLALGSAPGVGAMIEGSSASPSLAICSIDPSNKAGSLRTLIFQLYNCIIIQV